MHEIFDLLNYHPHEASTVKPTKITNPEYFHKVIDCQYACPAHTAVPEYIRCIDEERYEDAYMVNWVSNVFPGILGRICDRPCEPACRRGRIDEEPVAICRLKRVCADNKREIHTRLPEPPAEKNGKKICCIGGGPASLTVARDLILHGYEVDLYDDQAKAGGFIRTQVPSFRLPEKVLDEEVNCILDFGVNSVLNTYVSSLKSILEKGYDAIFVGTGAPRGRDLPDLKGRQEADSHIHIGIEWLASVLYSHVKKTEKKVLVLGGGNTAMDCCRTARRLGSSDVKVVVRSPKEDMKASPWEIEDAEREDIAIIPNHVPLEFVVENGTLVGMRFDRVEPRYEDGKRSLVSTGEEPVFMECNEVILAVGQHNAFPWIEPDIGLDFDSHNMPVVDEITLQSSLKQVFFGGDAAFGPRNVITAVAHGHQAALSIHLLCQGKDLYTRPHPQVSLTGQQMGIHDWVYDSHVTDEDRQSVPMVDKHKSIQDRLIEVELGYDHDLGQKEAKRCLNCDVQTVFEVSTCIECDACVDICPVSCINFIENNDENELRDSLIIPAHNSSQSLYVSSELPTGRIMAKDENVCLHCGLCAERCPTASWEMIKFVYEAPQVGMK